MKKVFIVNPKSGQGKSIGIMKYVVEKCKQRKEDYEVIYTSYKEQATEIAKEKSNKDTIIYSVGGDGTINEIVNGMAYTDGYLSVIPAGSGNDFIRTINKYKDELFDIDLGKVNDKYFVNSASIGLDSEIGYNAGLMKKFNIPKSQIYNASILYTFFKFKPYKVNFINEEKLITILTITNGIYYGGGFPVTPDAQLNDGYLNLCMADDVKMYEVPPLLLKLKKGTHYGQNHISNSKIKNLKISLNHDVICGIDGESIKSDNFNFKVCENAIHYYNKDDYEIKRLIMSK